MRRRATCKQQIGEDFGSIRSNISIQHPSNRSMFYAVIGLDNRNHGSAAEVSHCNNVLDSLGIENNVIRPTRSKQNGTHKTNDIFVAYDASPIFSKLAKKSIKGTHTLHHDLTTFLLTVKQTDKSRKGVKIDQKETSTNLRLRFGFGRVQATPAPTAKLTCIH